MFLMFLLSLPSPLQCVSIPSQSLYPPCPKDHWFCPLPSIKKSGVGAGTGAGAGEGVGAGAGAGAGAVKREDEVAEKDTKSGSGAGEESPAREEEYGECVSLHSPCNGLCPDQTLWYLSTFYSAVHCAVLHCTALHCTALHCTALHVSDLHIALHFLLFCVLPCPLSTVHCPLHCAGVLSQASVCPAAPSAGFS